MRKEDKKKTPFLTHNISISEGLALPLARKHDSNNYTSFSKLNFS